MARGRPRPDPYANDTERKYAYELDARKRVGEIVDWGYARIRLEIGNGAWYKPDFDVLNTDGTVEFHEVKGWWREAARVRIKAAAKRFPHYRFFAITRGKGRGAARWVVEEISP